jgi:hypothetical protein
MRPWNQSFDCPQGFALSNPLTTLASLHDPSDCYPCKPCATCVYENQANTRTREWHRTQIIASAPLSWGLVLSSLRERLPHVSIVRRIAPADRDQGCGVFLAGCEISLA